MKKVLILIICLMLIGCGSTEPAKLDLDSGKVGLTFEFKGMPISVYEGDGIDFNLEFRNLGRFDITNGNIMISGYEKNYIQNGFSEDTKVFSDNQITLQNSIGKFSIAGKSEGLPKGGVDEIAVFGFVNDLSSDIYEPPISVEVCYVYQTNANAEVCFDVGYAKTKIKSKECDYANVKLNRDGQGGPVGLTNIRVDPRKDYTILEFEVSHFTEGVIFNPSLLNSCFKPFNLTDENYIVIDDVQVGGQSIKANCVNLDENGMFRLDKTPPIFVCTYEHKDAKGAFPRPVNVIMTYGHLIQDDKTVKVERG